MADEFDSTLGFDATEALKTFKQLELFVNAYTKALKLNASTTGDFNSAQGQSDNVLNNLAAAAAGAREELEKLATAEQNAANAARKVAEAQKTAADLDARKNAVAARATVVNSLPTGLAGKATPAEVSAFDKSVDAFQKLVLKTGTSQAQVQKILANLSANYSGTERQIRDSILNIIAANNNLGRTNFNAVTRALAQVGAAGRKAGNDVSSGVDSATKSSTGFLLSWQSIQRFFAGQVLFRVFSGITSEINTSVETAKKLQVTLAQIQTIAPKAIRGGNLQDVGTFTKSVSNDFGISQVEVATATYEAFSNQVGDTAQTLNFMREAAKFSVAAVTSLNNAQAVGAGVINAYGLATADTSQIFDKLFKTIDVGRVTGEELAGSLGKILPIASQLGVSLDEVLSGIATLTIQGLSAEEAVTRLNNVFIRLIKPAGELQTALDKLGVTSISAFVQTEGLVGALTKIRDQTDGSVEELAKLIPNIRGFAGAVSLAAQDGKLFANSLQAIREESSNANTSAFDLIQATPAIQLQKSIEQLKNVFISDFGNPAIDAINKVIESLGGAEVAAKAFLTLLAVGGTAAVALFGVQLVGAIGTATAAMVSLATAGGVTLGTLGGLAAFTGFGAVAAGVALLVFELNKANNVAQQLRDTEEQAAKLNQASTKQAIQAQQQLNRATEDATNTSAKTVLNALQQRQAAFADEKTAALTYQKSITDDLKNQINTRQKLVDKFVSDVAKSIEKSSENIKKIGNDTRDFEFKINQQRFDRNLKLANNDPGKEARLLSARVAELLDAQNRAAKLNTPEGNDFAKTLNDEALSTANKLADIAGKRAQGEGLVNTVLSARQKLNNSLIQQEQAKEAAATAADKTLTEQQAAIHANVDEVNTLLKALSKAENSAERSSLSKKLGAATSSLQEKLSNFTAPGITGTDFENQLKKIKASFDNLEGTPVPLNLSVDAAIASIENKLKAARFSAEVELKIQNLTGVGGGTDQIGKLQAKIGELRATANTRSSATNAFLEDQGNLQTALDNSIRRFDALKKEAKDSVTTAQNAFGLLSKSLGGPDLGATAAIEPINKFIGKINELKATLQNAVETGNTGALVGIDKQLGNLQNALAGEQGAQQTLQVVQGLRQQIEQVGSSLEKVGQDKQKLNAAQEAQQTIQALETLIQNLRADQSASEALNTNLQAMGPAGQQGANTAAAALQNLQAQQERAIALQQELNAAQAAGGGGGGGQTEGRARGGRIEYFSSGGFVSRGTDTIPAMLSPNEFVVNAASSRKFFSQLVAINAGVQPSYHANGGTVQNNTFTGDIQLNLPPGSSSVDGRAAASAIQRELRRKSSRLL